MANHLLLELYNKHSKAYEVKFLCVYFGEFFSTYYINWNIELPIIELPIISNSFYMHVTQSSQYLIHTGKEYDFNHHELEMSVLITYQLYGNLRCFEFRFFFLKAI